MCFRSTNKALFHLSSNSYSHGHCNIKHNYLRQVRRNWVIMLDLFLQFSKWFIYFKNLQNTQVPRWKQSFPSMIQRCLANVGVFKTCMYFNSFSFNGPSRSLLYLKMQKVQLILRSSSKEMGNLNHNNN